MTSYEQLLQSAGIHSIQPDYDNIIIDQVDNFVIQSHLLLDSELNGSCNGNGSCG